MCDCDGIWNDGVDVDCACCVVVVVSEIALDVEATEIELEDLDVGCVVQWPGVLLEIVTPVESVLRVEVVDERMVSVLVMVKLPLVLMVVEWSKWELAVVVPVLR